MSEFNLMVNMADALDKAREPKPIWYCPECRKEHLVARGIAKANCPKCEGKMLPGPAIVHFVPDIDRSMRLDRGHPDFGITNQQIRGSAR